MLGIEDVASYSDFFSPEEWDAIQTGDWSQLPDEDWGAAIATEQVSFGVTVHGHNCAAQRDQVAPEDLSTAGARRHAVSAFIPGVSGCTEHGYVLDCRGCSLIGETDSFEEAQVVAHLHEQFVAMLVDRWDLS